MIDVALYQPEIPPNTGNIIRLCANTGVRLHLIHPLGFRIDDASLRRAGLDYHEMATVEQHASLDALRAVRPQARWLAFTTRGSCRHDQWTYRDGDILLFGPESRGLPAEVLDSIPSTQWLRVPMRSGNRSLNLSNAVAVGVYEAWRQRDYAE
jgi:tRNA (cytidine/uridine-2'-O-)-methyltransferase